jgi:hypothetical protein
MLGDELGVARDVGLDQGVKSQRVGYGPVD